LILWDGLIGQYYIGIPCQDMHFYKALDMIGDLCSLLKSHNFVNLHPLTQFVGNNNLTLPIYSGIIFQYKSPDRLRRSGLRLKKPDGLFFDCVGSHIS